MPPNDPNVLLIRWVPLQLSSSTQRGVLRAVDVPRVERMEVSQHQGLEMGEFVGFTWEGEDTWRHLRAMTPVG